MEVQVIDRLEDFEKLRPAWNQLHAIDPHASVFMSWAWMDGWLRHAPYEWMILGARLTGSQEWAAFWPISPRGATKTYRIDQVREIHMAGEPLADYTGFVCAPQFERAAFEALADFLASRIQWDQLRLKEIEDPRLDRFLQCIPAHTIRVTNHRGTCCPYLSLPPTWPEYLRDCLSSATRKSLKKRLKTAERQFRVTHSCDQTIDSQIDELVKLAAMRRPQTVADELPRCRDILRSCARAGFASIIMLWSDGTPVAGQAYFTDHKSNSISMFLTGFDNRFAKFAPGKVVEAICIREAIEGKMRTVDFLRGEEPYKFELGARPRHNRHVTVVRRGFQTATRLTFSRMRQKLHI